MARAALALTAIVFGMIMAFVGGLLYMLCWFSGGLLCQGTAIADIANVFLYLGVPMLVLGITVGGALRKREVPPPAPFVVSRTAAPASSPARARVASECPKCGGPVKASDRECEWCKAPLL